MAPKHDQPHLSKTSPTPFESPFMLIIGLLSMTIWSMLAVPLLALKGMLYSVIALPIAWLKLSQFKKARVKPGDGYCLVTGASSGIGAAMARELARRGFDLILIARRVDRLDELANELHSISEKKAKRKIDVRSIQCDLCEHGQVSKLCAELESTPVVILVNNAGFGNGRPRARALRRAARPPGRPRRPPARSSAPFARAPSGKAFCEQDCEVIGAMLEVGVRSLTQLTHCFAQRMVRAGRGHILNTVSIAGFSPGPIEAVYHATKGYVLMLSEAINFEMRSTGVTSTALCPGPVETEFFDVSMSKKSLNAQNPFKLTPSFVAATGVHAMFAGRSVVVPGIVPKVMVEMQSILPRALKLWFNFLNCERVAARPARALSPFPSALCAEPRLPARLPSSAPALQMRTLRERERHTFKTKPRAKVAPRAGRVVGWRDRAWRAHR